MAFSSSFSLFNNLSFISTPVASISLLPFSPSLFLPVPSPWGIRQIQPRANGSLIVPLPRELRAQQLRNSTPFQLFLSSIFFFLTCSQNWLNKASLLAKNQKKTRKVEERPGSSILQTFKPAPIKSRQQVQ